eukprot:6214458-Pleurochrysis_carterae.AAC.11
MSLLKKLNVEGAPREEMKCKEAKRGEERQKRGRKDETRSSDRKAHWSARGRQTETQLHERGQSQGRRRECTFRRHTPRG